MKKSEIRVGGFYKAKVNNQLVTVRVDKITEYDGFSGAASGRRIKAETKYHVTNMTTGRTTSFRSPMKFRSEVKPVATPKGAALPTSTPSIGSTTSQGKPSTVNTVVSQSQEGEKRSDPILVGAQNTPATSGIVVANLTKATTDPAPSGLAAKLQTRPTDNSPHVIVEARAGTGKTTTLICGLQKLKGLPVAITPSPQQAAVWEQLCKSPRESTVLFVAFNKSIAEELKSRVPPGCEASTMHSFGYRIVRKAFGNVQVAGDKIPPKVNTVTAEILGQDLWDLRRDKPNLVNVVKELVELCKMNLTMTPNGTPFKGSWESELAGLISHYEIDMEGVDQSQVFDLVPRVLERCKDVTKDKTIDYADMIWLPIVLDLPVIKYDILLVDEAQDLNRCQQELAKRAGRRLILCGDPKQAIYGFAGADNESMNRMAKELGRECPECGGLVRWFSDGKNCEKCSYGESSTDRGIVVLPLTVTRRCGKAIVQEANKIVPDFEAHETNGEGVISSGRYPTDKYNKERPKPHYTDRCEEGNMVLCRVNAPLVSQCFRFIKAGKKANIQGRDVGQGLISTVRKLAKKENKQDPDGVLVTRFIMHLGLWHTDETNKENAKKNPSEARLIAISDRYDCIMCFTEDCTRVSEVIRKIENVFADKQCPICKKKYGEGADTCYTPSCNKPKLVRPEGVRLSSIHKAKGLEADVVFLLEPDKATVPHPMAKGKWQIEQEWNLRYVAITRAKKELVYVS